MIDISPDLWYTITVILRGYGGIGRRAGFRIRWVTVQVRPLLPAPTEKDNYRLSFFVGLRDRARLVRERICAAYSFEDTTARTYPRQVFDPCYPYQRKKTTTGCLFLLVCVIGQDMYVKERASVLLGMRPQGRIPGRSIDPCYPYQTAEIRTLCRWAMGSDFSLFLMILMSYQKMIYNI